MKHARFFLALLIVMIFTISPVGQTEPSAAERLDGFTTDKSAWELEYEALLKAIPDPAVCQQHNRTLSAHPTLVGSDWDWWNVQYSLEQLRSRQHVGGFAVRADQVDGTGVRVSQDSVKDGLCQSGLRMWRSPISMVSKIFRWPSV